MSIEIWVEGVILEFADAQPCSRAIIRKGGNHEIILADVRDGAIHRIDRCQLGQKKARGELKFLADARDFGDLSFVDLSEKEQIEVNRRFKYIQRLLEHGVTKVTEKNAAIAIRELAKELGEKAPHWQSVRNWYKAFSDAGGKMRGLYPKHRFKGATKAKIDERVVEIINRAAAGYLKRSRPTIASAWRNVEADIIAHNLENPEDPLKIPAFRTVQKRILARTYQSKQEARSGIREPEGTDGPITTNRILERVEIDHTQLDLQVLHDDHKTLLGRPHITVLIDHYSYMVLGFQLSFEKPSFASVCMACRNAFVPKDDFLSSLGCEGVWPAHGIPETLVTDNGNEFWGKNFISVADELGPVFQYCPIRRANYKSRVERFFGVVNSLVLDDLPGVVRKPGRSGEGYDARQEAKMTFTEFKRYFTTWLTEIYHNLPVAETGMTPNELWVQSEEELPVPVESETELAPVLMATDTRELDRDGIDIFVLKYNSPVLKDLYRRDGPRTVIVKSNPFDIGYILVLDDKNKVYIKVECTQFSYASGLSKFAHDKIRAKVRLSAKSKLENVELQKAKVKLANQRKELHAQNKRRKTQTTASEAARVEQVGVDSIKLVVDNSKRVLHVTSGGEEDALDMEGWSVDK